MSIVHVTFVEAGSGRPLGQSEIPADQLPESFAPQTTLHIGEQAFAVERADPPTRSASIACGTLRLSLRVLVSLDPSDILMSLPTLEACAPPLGAACADAVCLHEDDWRQRELIAASLEGQIQGDLSSIRTIHETQAVGGGFRTLHLRTQIPDPLPGIALDAAALGLAGPPRPIAIGSSAQAVGRRVVGGFAFEVGGGLIYGRQAAGRIVALGLTSGLDPAPLAAVAHAHDLVFVDWCSTRRLRSDGATFR